MSGGTRKSVSKEPASRTEETRACAVPARTCAGANSQEPRPRAARGGAARGAEFAHCCSLGLGGRGVESERDAPPTNER